MKNGEWNRLNLDISALLNTGFHKILLITKMFFGEAHRLHGFSRIFSWFFV
ncbi:MAG: hypothetical protein LBR51_05185 [Bacteroidales bacterium]|nr:hypothetical protein [Bacteroidales bacterium]